MITFSIYRDTVAATVDVLGRVGVGGLVARLTSACGCQIVGYQLYPCGVHYDDFAAGSWWYVAGDRFEIGKAVD